MHGAGISAFDVVGGKDILGTDAAAGTNLVDLIRRGLPVATADFVLESARLTLAELDRIVMPRRTLAHRRKVGTLTAEQSDRLMRVARVVAMAEETFGEQAKAGAWLRRPTSALGGVAPLDLLDTDVGARAVETLLGRITYGIAA